jgi:hypothetical protein
MRALPVLVLGLLAIAANLGFFALCIFIVLKMLQWFGVI